jgi:hypothetical protein
MDITQLRNGGLEMLRIRFKTILCLSLILIPISTQTVSDCILSDNWAIKREIMILKIKIEEREGLLWELKRLHNVRLANKEINRYGKL